MHRLNEDEQIAKTISVQIKYPNFKTTNRSMTLNEYTDSREVIFSTIMNIYQTHFINKTIRLVGIGLSNLELKEQVNQRHSPLFDDYQEPVVKSKIQKDLMADLVESINAKFSRNIAHIAKHKLTK
jgi:DNA polymerase-4